MTIFQNEIEPEAGRTVVSKGFFEQPRLCSNKMITARFVEAVKPKSCYYWFRNCTDLTEIKNMKNLYTNECTDMEGMFYNCSSLMNLNIINFLKKIPYSISMVFF